MRLAGSVPDHAPGSVSPIPGRSARGAARPAATLLGLSLAGALAAAEWQTVPGGRWREFTVPATGRTGFTRLPPETTGVTFTNHLAETTSARNRILENGSGVALGDVDGDGWCDLYFCRLEGDNVLYRNRGGWRFEDITARAGVACPGQYSTGAAFADLDGDGDLDLLVNALGGGTRAFRNDGTGRFEEITGTRLDRRLGATSLALADIDGDGDLDLYVTNYRTTTYKDRPPGLVVETRQVGDRIVVTPEDRFIPLMPRAGGVEVMERGDRDYLYVNDGTGRFAPVAWNTGSFLDQDGRPLVRPPTDWGLTVLFRDLNGDGAPDIWVCNDFFFWPDRVWLNEESRRFRAAPPNAFRCWSVSAMGGDVADFNRDGHPDVFIADMVSRTHAWRHRQRPQMMQGLLQQDLENPINVPEVARNTLYLARGDGTWAEIAQFAGVDFTEWSWGTVFLDADLDGWEDLIIPTGNNHDVQDADALRAQDEIRRLPDSLENRLRGWRLFPPLATPLLAYRNNRDLTFTDVTAAWGFSEPGPWQGLALADLDNDGDLDLAINRLNNAAGLYRNDSPAPRLAVRLAGTPPNTRGVGARITVQGGPVTQSQEMIAGGRYVSGDDFLRVFAAGAPTNRLRLEVAWRDGTRTEVEDARPNRLYEVSQAAAQSVPAAPPPAPPRWFEDLTAPLAHVHADTPVHDFEFQPLLARKLSTGGPAAAWFDLDGDGWDELILGAGRDGALAVYRNVPGPAGHRIARRLVGSTLRPADFDAAAGTAAVLAWRDPHSGPTLLLARPARGTNPPPVGVQELALDPAARVAQLPDFPGPAGPLALADVDGDGALELFAGGAARLGRYPEAAPGALMRRGANGWQRDAATSALFQNLGPVNAARFTDLTGDGLPEMVLAGDWGPPRLFRNEAGRLAPWNPPLRAAGLLFVPARLDELTGCWNGVAAGDFDGDGRPDLVLTGWGRNTRFQRYLARPLRLYFGDFDGDGVVELLDTYLVPELGRYAPWRDYDTVTRALPFVAARVPTYRKYGEAGVEDLLGEHRAAVRYLEAATLDSLVLLNRGDHFAARPLPPEAQFAPAFGAAVADFDGDGHEDLFLAQNFFGVEPETSRYDAGRGLLLRGDGTGGFTPLSSRESGLALDGEQRAAAVADFDGDGRADLVVTQHRGPTALGHNLIARPGLRVRLAGPPGNPTGLGAALRVGRDGRFGPARELHAGSGGWAQDSAVTVLARPDGANQLQVRWPGGKSAVYDLPASAREVKVTPAGLEVLAPRPGG